MNVSGTAEISGTHTGTHSGTSSGANTGDEPLASDSAEGVIEIAVQSEMEAASDTGRAVVPGRMHFHPAMPKAAGRGAAAGGITGTPYNVASIVRNAADFGFIVIGDMP